jgi:hypothetical protein
MTKTAALALDCDYASVSAGTGETVLSLPRRRLLAVLSRVARLENIDLAD